MLDSFRQDQLVVQMVTLMDKLLRRENLDLRLTPYKVLSTSVDYGFVQYIESLPLRDVLHDYSTVHVSTAAYGFHSFLSSRAMIFRTSSATIAHQPMDRTESNRTLSIITSEVAPAIQLFATFSVLEIAIFTIYFCAKAVACSTSILDTSWVSVGLS